MRLLFDRQRVAPHCLGTVAAIRQQGAFLRQSPVEQVEIVRRCGDQSLGLVTLGLAASGRIGVERLNELPVGLTDMRRPRPRPLDPVM